LIPLNHFTIYQHSPKQSLETIEIYQALLPASEALARLSAAAQHLPNQSALFFTRCFSLGKTILLDTAQQRDRLKWTVGDALDLDQDIDQKITDQRGPGWRFFGKVLGVNRIEAREILTALEPDHRLDHVGKFATGLGKNFLQALDTGARLSFDIAIGHRYAVTHRHLSSDKYKVSGTDSA
jgi:hypothetical protein